jgi:ABC-type glutathione transport system ATPase component
MEAVRQASLEVLEGGVSALVGETGSGKATLGPLLTGQLEADGVVSSSRAGTSWPWIGCSGNTSLGLVLTNCVKCV